MNLREMSLPYGWYPREKAGIDEFLAPFAGERGKVSAVVLPHAGWYYSGAVAALAVSLLEREAETVAVIGGHLAKGMPPLYAAEDAVKTPIGSMEIDAELRDAFIKLCPSMPDRYKDNTVEVLLPMVRFFFPRSKLLWLRFPSDISSFEYGKILAETVGGQGKRIVVLASTDLTHYGENYGFAPHGKGIAAIEWVKKVNDAAFIKAVLEGNPARVLERAESDFSACSAGAVAGGLGFMSASCFAFGGEKIQRTLLAYRTSADGEAEVPPSFVGYAAISLGGQFQGNRPKPA